jgi:hypothetical protein
VRKRERLALGEAEDLAPNIRVHTFSEYVERRLVAPLHGFLIDLREPEPVR